MGEGRQAAPWRTMTWNVLPGYQSLQMRVCMSGTLIGKKNEFLLGLKRSVTDGDLSPWERGMRCIVTGRTVPRGTEKMGGPGGAEGTRGLERWVAEGHG